MGGGRPVRRVGVEVGRGDAGVLVPLLAQEENCCCRHNVLQTTLNYPLAALLLFLCSPIIAFHL